MSKSDEAIKKAEDNLAVRLGGMNEFRQALTDQAVQFITRAEMIAQIEKAYEMNDKKIILLESKMATLQNAFVGLLGALVVGLILNILI